MTNCDLQIDATTLLFMLGFLPLIDANSKLFFCLKDIAFLPSNILSLKKSLANNTPFASEFSAIILPISNKTALFYYVNRLTNVYHLGIPLFFALNILLIAHKDGHLGFSC